MVLFMVANLRIMSMLILLFVATGTALITGVSATGQALGNESIVPPQMLLVVAMCSCFTNIGLFGVWLLMVIRATASSQTFCIPLSLVGGIFYQDADLTLAKRLQDAINNHGEQANEAGDCP